MITVSDQVDPQPVTSAFRPAGEPLAGAIIIAFEGFGAGSYRLEYTIDGKVGSVDYAVTDTSFALESTSPTGDVTTETYCR